MKENDEITGLFRSRLDGAEMTVREGFWEKLQSDLPQAAATGRPKTFLTPRLYRITAAASVVFVLGAASAAFWYFSPKEEIQEAFTQVAAMNPDGNIKGDVVQENFPSIHQAHPTAQKPGIKHPANNAPAGMIANSEDDESVSVHVSITITQRVYGNNNQQPGNGFYGHNSGQNGSYQSGTDRTNANSDINSAVASNEESPIPQLASASDLRKWAIKAALGTSLPKGSFNMPFTAGVSVERRLNKHLSLEAGLQYSGLSGNGTLHTLGVPVKLNAMLASTPKVDFYATVGGAVEKCIAGALDNSFDAEPAQLSVAAGLGVRYKMNDRFALFAEPSVSHHFDTDSKTRTLRTERPTNLNLLCGVRMTY